MQINLIYDASVAGAPAGFTTAMTTAAQFLDNLIYNPITVNVRVGWNEAGGQPITVHDTNFFFNVGTTLSYAQLRSVLAANETSATGAAAVNSLPTVDPTNGGIFQISTAQEKAWGMLPANGSAIDGSIGFSSSPSSGGTWNFTGNPISGEADFVGIAERELTHVLGRDLALQTPGSGIYRVLDLFHYSAPGQLNLVNGTTAYFSIDGGNTSLENFNPNALGGDWLSPPQADAFAANDYYYKPFTAVDKTAVEVVGFNVTGATISVQNDPTATRGQVLPLSSLVTISDPGHVGYQQLELWDSNGTPTSGQFVVNGMAQTGGHEIDVTPADVASTVFDVGTLGGTDTLYARLLENNGTLTAWQPFTVTAPADRPPVVTAPNVTATHGETSVTATNLFTASDPDGDTITTYAFYDSNGSGHFVVNGAAQPINTEIDVSAANLSQVSYAFGPTGSTPDTLYIRANDGALWSNWTPFTATPAPDRAPVVTAPSVTATHGETSVAATSLFSVSDADNDTMTQFEFYDATGNGSWVVNGVAQGAQTIIPVAAANLSQVSYAFGPTGSAPDTLYVRANDGYEWGAWTPFTATPAPDHAPVVTAPSVTATHGETSVAASSLFSVSDADNDTMTQYQFYDATGNGSWVVNGVTQAAQTVIPVAAANLSQVSYAFGPTGSAPDTLYVRANDGYEWSAWTPFTATPGPDHAPIVSASNLAAAHNQNFAASSMFSVTDADGDSMTKYDFYDATGSGHFVLNGVAQSTATIIDITAAQLANMSYQSGSGTDQLYMRAFDGDLWSGWQAFTVTAPIDQAPVVTAPNAGIAAMNSVAASSLFTVSDPEGDGITTYDFYNATGSGHFVVNGTVEAAGTIIPVTAAQLAQTSYVAGSVNDQLYVRASDGTMWSAWTPFMAGPAPTVTASNIALAAGVSVAASSLFSATDGGTFTQYDFSDATGNGHFTVNGTTQATASIVGITAAQLAQTGYVAGAGTDQLYVRAFDGTNWSAWTPFTAGPAAPTVTASNVSIGAGQSVAASSLFTATDTDGGSITAYDFYDATGAGHFVVNGASEATATVIPVTSAQLAQTSYVAGSGTDQLYVRAFEGTLWSNWMPFTAGPTPPLVTSPNLSTVPGQTIAASNLFSVTDGGTITDYNFYDATGNGHFTVNGTTQPTAAIIDVSPANLAQTNYVSGNGTDQLYVRAYDGTTWSAWTPFTVASSTPAIINAGATLELGTASAAPVTFFADTGTLKFDNPSSFAGTVAGMTGNDSIDFADINFATVQTPSFTGTSAGGTLHVTDGIHTADIALLGNYMASAFVPLSDGHGGTSVIDPPADQNNITLTIPVHA